MSVGGKINFTPSGITVDGIKMVRAEYKIINVDERIGWIFEIGGVKYGIADDVKNPELNGGLKFTATDIDSGCVVARGKTIKETIWKIKRRSAKHNEARKTEVYKKICEVLNFTGFYIGNA